MHRALGGRGEWKVPLFQFADPAAAVVIPGSLLNRPLAAPGLAGQLSKAAAILGYELL